MKVYMYFTGLASNIVRDMMETWLDGWGKKYRSLDRETIRVLVENEILVRDAHGNLGIGDRYESGVTEISDGKTIVVLFADEADIVCGLVIDEDEENVDFILEKFREIEKIL